MKSVTQTFNGRVKPRFEDLAYAAESKANLEKPDAVILPPKDHTQAISQLRDMSQSIGRTQYNAGAVRATAEIIAQDIHKNL